MQKYTSNQRGGVLYAELECEKHRRNDPLKRSMHRVQQTETSNRNVTKTSATETSHPVQLNVRQRNNEIEQ